MVEEEEEFLQARDLVFCTLALCSFPCKASEVGPCSRRALASAKRREGKREGKGCDESGGGRFKGF